MQIFLGMSQFSCLKCLRPRKQSWKKIPLQKRNLFFWLDNLFIFNQLVGGGVGGRRWEFMALQQALSKNKYKNGSNNCIWITEWFRDKPQFCRWNPLFLCWCHWHCQLLSLFLVESPTRVVKACYKIQKEYVWKSFRLKDLEADLSISEFPKH